MVKKTNLLDIKKCQNLSNKQIQKLYSQYINPGLTESLNVFSFGNDVVKSANGSEIKLKNKKTILDFTGGLGVLNFGHNPKEILSERINFQKKNNMEVHKSFFSQYSAGLAHNLAQILPGNLNYSYFCNSGAEAIDGAIKLAYKYYNGKRKYILHSDIAFHGKLLGSLSISNYKESTFKFPTINFSKKYKFNNCTSLKKVVEKNKKNIFAIIVEPYSASTYKENSSEFLKLCRELSDKYDIKLIFDEIYTGFGKARDMFYCNSVNVIPDILILSKSFGGGKSSISAYSTNKKTLKKSYGNLNDALLHSTTYNGFGEECITAMAAIDLMVKKELYKNSKQIEVKLKPNFLDFKKKFPNKISEYRGLGTMHGFIFYTKFLPIKKIQKLLPISVLKDDKFLDKLLASALMDDLYKSFNILSTIKYNQEVILCVEPMLVASNKELNYCIKSLNELFQKDFGKMILKFILNSLKRKLFK